MGIIRQQARMGDETDFLRELENAAEESTRRGGNFNGLNSSGPLYYPSDMLNNDNFSAYSDNEITNWIEFRTFGKQSSSLDSTLTKLLTGGTPTLESLQDQFDTFTDETNEETRQKISELSVFQDNFTREPDQLQQDTRLSPANEATGDSIFLYLPGKINYDDSFKYESASFGNIRALGDSSALGGVVGLNVLRKLAGAADKLSETVLGSELNAGAALSASMGQVLNPRKEQLFQEVDFRTFAFEFVFVPRNQKEAETVAKIIKTFRFHAHPESSQNGAFFSFPSEFEIKYKTFRSDEGLIVDNPALPKIGRCFLQKITTNYTPNDVYYSLQNGIPPQITLSLQFNEAEVITRQHVNGGY